MYLDTNVLVQRAGLDSLELSVLRALGATDAIDIVVPSIVADEVESNRLRNIEAAFDSLRAADREARRYGQLAHLGELPNPGELARSCRARLESEYVLAATPESAPAEALRREAFRIRPARGGVGARDSAIWLTAKEDHLQREEAGYLVTRNSKDFAKPGDPESLHPMLANELASHAYPLTLASSVSSLIAELADEAAPLLDQQALTGLEAFDRAARRLFQDPVFMATLQAPSELGTPDGGRLFAASGLTFRDIVLREARSHEVGGQRVMIGRVSFNAGFELGTLEKTGPGQVQRLMPVICSATALVWFLQTGGGAGLAVEVSQVVAATLRAA